MTAPSTQRVNEPYVAPREDLHLGLSVCSKPVPFTSVAAGSMCLVCADHFDAGDVAAVVRRTIPAGSSCGGADGDAVVGGSVESSGGGVVHEGCAAMAESSAAGVELPVPDAGAAAGAVFAAPVGLVLRPASGRGVCRSGQFAAPVVRSREMVCGCVGVCPCCDACSQELVSAGDAGGYLTCAVDCLRDRILDIVVSIRPLKEGRS